MQSFKGANLGKSAPKMSNRTDEWSIFVLFFHSFLQKNLSNSLIYGLLSMLNGI